MNAAILVVDDKVKLGRSLAQNLELLGYPTHVAINSREAFKFLAEQPIRTVLLDVALGSEDGLAVLEDMLTQYPELPVIMITGYGTVEMAVKATKMGAFDFIQKPLQFDKLLAVVKNALQVAALRAENLQFKQRLATLSPGAITRSPSVQAVLDKARKLAATDLPVLITGESGTGKELLADFIHNHSPRSARPMHRVNSSAIAENLLDNELFGHERGAYTGADSTFVGLFEQAHGSTLLLDEIGDMALPTQAKILRALQQKEIKRLGAGQVVKVDVRVIACTNRDLARLRGEGRFREDLFYRLNAAALHLPPLRERREDIPLLIEHCLREFAADYGKTVTGLDDAAAALFLEYPWPGNIRELRNTVFYAAALTESGRIGAEALPEALSPREGAAPPPESIEASEKKAILRALQKTGDNKSRAAALLGITRKTLYNKLQRYGLDRP